MAKAVYEIVQSGEQWFIRHDGEDAGPYMTKEAAFEASRGAASRSITDGFAVEIHVPPGPKDATDHEADIAGRI